MTLLNILECVYFHIPEVSEENMNDTSVFILFIFEKIHKASIVKLNKQGDTIVILSRRKPYAVSR